MSGLAVNCRRVVHIYRADAGDVVALAGVDLAVAPGETLVEFRLADGEGEVDAGRDDDAADRGDGERAERVTDLAEAAHRHAAEPRAQRFEALGVVGVPVGEQDPRRARVGDRVALQGNLDPNVLFANPEQIAAEARAVLDSFGTPHTDPNTQGPTQIFNLGHGISQFTPPEHVTALVEAVHSHSKKLRNPA